MQRDFGGVQDVGMRLVRFPTDMNSNLTRMRQSGVRTGILLVAGAAGNCNQEQEQGKRTCRDKISNYRHLSLFTFLEHSIGRARTLFINLSKRSENWSLFSQSFVQTFHLVAAFFQFASICRHVVVSMKTAL